MKRRQFSLHCAVGLWCLTGGNFAFVTGEPSLAPNLPPGVAITFPKPSQTLPSAFVRLEAAASDPDGSVRYVRFLEGTNLVGVSTKPPYSVEWSPRRPTGQGFDELVPLSMSAVAVDDLGAPTRSDPVSIVVDPHLQTHPLLEFVSPKEGEIFTSLATFEVAVRLLISTRPLETPPPFPVEFHIGTNVVRASPDRPYSITVTNLPEGEYTLRAVNFELFSNDPPPIKIRVAKIGVSGITRTGSGVLKLGAFNLEDRVDTVVQSSTNLNRWIPLLTNHGSFQSFYFLTEHTNQPQEFYRLVSGPSQE